MEILTILLAVILVGGMAFAVLLGIVLVAFSEFLESLVETVKKLKGGLRGN